MKKIQVSTAKDEIEASIVKGYIESFGIKTWIISLNNNLPRRYVSSTYMPLGVYVEEKDAEEAKKVLKERNF